MTNGLILASLCFAYLYYRIDKWMKFRARIDDMKIEEARKKEQMTICAEHGVKNYDVERRQFASSK